MTENTSRLKTKSVRRYVGKSVGKRRFSDTGRVAALAVDYEANGL